MVNIWVENDSGETGATDNANTANDVIMSPNNATTAIDVTASPSLTGTDTENPGGGESTGGQNSQNGQQAGAEVMPSTPMRSALMNLASGIMNSPRRALEMTGIIAADQGNEDRGEATTEA